MKMRQDDTPPSSPEIREDPDAMVNEDDMEEVLEVNESDADFNEDEMEEGRSEEEERMEYIPERDDAKCVFQKHTSAVFYGSLTNDGKLAATGGEDDRAFLWDTTTGEPVLECTGHKDSVTFAVFNQENTYLATGDMSGIIKVWRMSDKISVWDYNMADITWMQWHGVANILFAASVDGEVYMWKIPDGECKILQGFGQRVETAVVLPDGKRIAIGYENGVIRIMDLKLCTALHTISSEMGHSGAITTMDCHSNNNLIISASVDGKTILSTSQNGKVVAVLQNLNDNRSSSSNDQEIEEISNWVETASFHKDLENLIAATGTVNGEIFIWDIARQTIRHKIVQECGTSKLIWKEGTTLIYSAGLNGVLLCHDGRTGDCVQYFQGHSAVINDICISKDGKVILTTSEDCTARIFEIEAR